MAERSRRTPLLLVAAVVAVLLLSLAWTGMVEVPEDQVQVLPDGSGGVAAVWQPGWHWHLPWRSDPLPLPRAAIDASPEVTLTTTEGAAIVLDVGGRFRVAPGREETWIGKAGFVPFVEGLSAVTRDALEPRIRGADPASVFDEGSLASFAAAAKTALTDAGAEVSGFTLAAPVDKNPVAVAVARNRVAKLAHETGLKVLLVGWDGADWLMMKPLIAAGRLPNVAKLVAGGVSGDLRSQEPLLSPLVWTTIATGKPVSEHGIADFLVRDAATGTLVPISSTSRKVHALWTMLPAFGLSTDVVAWWATWPAETTQGTMVTDRVAYQLFDYAAERKKDPEGKVYPTSAWPRIAEQLVPPEEVSWRDVQRFVDVPADELERRWNALPADRRQEDPVNHLRKILATTRSYQNIALSLLDQQTDLTMVYYEGTDTVGHLFARYLPPRMPEVSAEDVRALRPRPADASTSTPTSCSASCSPRRIADTLVLLVSDHGFFTGRARPEGDPADWEGGAPQWHRLYGIIAGDGPGIGKGTVEGASIFDVTPTILAALGLPVPADMSGHPLAQLLPPVARRQPAAATAARQLRGAAARPCRERRQPRRRGRGEAARAGGARLHLPGHRRPGEGGHVGLHAVRRPVPSAVHRRDRGRHRRRRRRHPGSRHRGLQPGPHRASRRPLRRGGAPFPRGGRAHAVLRHGVGQPRPGGVGAGQTQSRVRPPGGRLLEERFDAAIRDHRPGRRGQAGRPAGRCRPRARGHATLALPTTRPTTPPGGCSRNPAATCRGRSPPTSRRCPSTRWTVSPWSRK